MHIRVVTLFPELVAGVGACGVVGRALDRGLADVECINPRQFAEDVHRTVDDRPYGGGPGMVMAYRPLAAAVEAAKAGLPDAVPVIGLSPQGKVFDQQAAERFSALSGMVLVAGRYEGIDERFIESYVDEELSLGDVVLSGGELAAMAVIDAVVRLLPGVLGDPGSAAEDSFSDGRLDHPHFTRPDSIDGRDVPAVLLSGDHERIARWRLRESLGRTWARRPDLLERRGLNEEEKALLAEWQRENDGGGSDDTS